MQGKLRTQRMKTKAERRAHPTAAYESRAASIARDGVMRHLVRKYAGLCVLCGEPVSFRQGTPNYATIDHIVPRSKGGLDVPSNYQLACEQCNLRRGNEDMPSVVAEVLPEAEAYAAHEPHDDGPF
jgi:5-methylcytosine-specific restriction endonuclease McrA